MNSENKSFEHRTVTLLARPPRGVVFIRNDDPDWQETIIRVIEWLSKCWGGCYWFIVPTDGEMIEETSWWILEKFDPDYIYQYKKTFADLKIGNPDEYTKFLDAQIQAYSQKYPSSDREAAKKLIEDQISQSECGPDIISGSLQEELKRRLNPFYTSNIVKSAGLHLDPTNPITHIKTALKNSGPIMTYFSPVIEGSKSIQLLLYSLLGKINSSLFKELHEERLLGLFRGEHPYSEEHLEDLVHSAWRGAGRTVDMPFAITKRDLSFYIDRKDKSTNNPVVIAGDTIQDFCFYYNLSRLMQNVYWLPMTLVDQFKYREAEAIKIEQPLQGEAAYLRWLLTELVSNFDSEEAPKILLYSHSLKLEDFDQIKQLSAKVSLPTIHDENITCRFVIQPSLDELLFSIRRLYVQEGIERSYIEQFYCGESINFLNTPIPNTLQDVPPNGQFWITEVRVENYLLPQLASIGADSLLYPRPTKYKNWFVRASSEGLAYFCPDIAYREDWGTIENVVVQPKLKLLDDFTIVEEIFRKIGYSIRYSDKGNYHRESVLKFEGFDPLAAFLSDERNFALLTRYIDRNKSIENKYGETLEVFLENDSRRYLSFKGMTTVLEDQTTAIIDYMIESKIMHRGFIFQCQRCRNAAWYSIEEITSTFTCSRCRTESLYKKIHWKKPEEPQWYYAIDEILYQGIRQNMHVPIFALKHLKQMRQDAFHYLPEIELRRDPTSSKADMELDFVIVKDGRIIIGEATISGKLNDHASEERKEIIRLRDLADVLHAKEVVLATYSDKWSEGTRIKVSEIFEKCPFSVYFLVKNDLKTSS